MVAQIEIEDFTYTRYPAATYVMGRKVLGVPTVANFKGNVQPLDYVERGALTREFEDEGEGNIVRQFKKLYTKTELQRGDIITRPRTGKQYKVWKVYDYEYYGTNVDHYKVIMRYIEGT